MQKSSRSRKLRKNNREKTLPVLMSEKVKVWIENSVIRCCSQVCTEASCPRFNECETVIIKIERGDVNGETVGNR